MELRYPSLIRRTSARSRGSRWCEAILACKLKSEMCNETVAQLVMGSLSFVLEGRRVVFVLVWVIVRLRLAELLVLLGGRALGDIVRVGMVSCVQNVTGFLVRLIGC